MMSVVFLLIGVVVEVVVQIRPYERLNIPALVAVDLSHAAPQSVCLNDDALENIPSMLITLDTSHLEMSQLNVDA